MEIRKNWDTYFIDICEIVATRSTCSRKHVGAILVRDKRIIATGYNGSIPGAAHCDDPEEFWYCAKCGHKQIETPRLVNGQGYVADHDIGCMGYQMKKMHGGHDMDEGHCVRTIHAEVNAIAQAALLGISTKDTVLYCNTMPCWNCFKTVVSVGVSEVVYRDVYRPEKHGRVGEAAGNIPGFTLRQFKPTTT